MPNLEEDIRKAEARIIKASLKKACKFTIAGLLFGYLIFGDAKCNNSSYRQETERDYDSNHTNK